MHTMYELRELRHSIDVGQREFAALLSVPLETLRTWDSGRRPVPVDVLLQAKRAVSEHAKNSEPVMSHAWAEPALTYHAAR